MHAVPSLYGAQDFLQPVEPLKIEICQEDCSFKDYPCDADMFHLCMELIAENNLEMSDVFAITELVNDGWSE